MALAELPIAELCWWCGSVALEDGSPRFHARGGRTGGWTGRPPLDDTHHGLARDPLQGSFESFYLHLLRPGDALEPLAAAAHEAERRAVAAERLVGHAVTVEQWRAYAEVAGPKSGSDRPRDWEQGDALLRRLAGAYPGDPLAQDPKDLRAVAGKVP